MSLARWRRGHARAPSAASVTILQIFRQHHDLHGIGNIAIFRIAVDGADKFIPDLELHTALGAVRRGYLNAGVAEKLAQMRLHGGAFGGGHGVVPSKFGCAGDSRLGVGVQTNRRAKTTPLFIGGYFFAPPARVHFSDERYSLAARHGPAPRFP